MNKRRPDGTECDKHEYVLAWEQLAAPVCDALGLTILAFDPDYLLADGARTVSLSTDMMRKLCQAFSLLSSLERVQAMLDEAGLGSCYDGQQARVLFDAAHHCRRALDVILGRL